MPDRTRETPDHLAFDTPELRAALYRDVEPCLLGVRARPLREHRRTFTDFPADAAFSLEFRWIYDNGQRSSWEAMMRRFRRLEGEDTVRAYWPPAAVGIETRSHKAKAAR